jgi:hypothetical protein
MNINYDNNKLSEIIRNLVLKANQVETGSDLKNATSGDIKEMTKPVDPLFLNETNFYDIYETFQNSLNTAIDDNVLGKGVKYSDIISKYNRLVKYITLNLKYYQLSTFKKDIIDKEMRKLVDNIDAVKSITKPSGATEMYYLTLERIINSLSASIINYEPIKVELKKTLEKIKNNLKNIEIKMQSLIDSYDDDASQVTKNKLDAEYKKYIQLYTRIATLYTRAERRQFKINDEAFNISIENILGYDSKRVREGLLEGRTTDKTSTITNSIVDDEIQEKKVELETIKEDDFMDTFAEEKEVKVEEKDNEYLNQIKSKYKFLITLLNYYEELQFNTQNRIFPKNNKKQIKKPNSNKLIRSINSKLPIKEIQTFLNKLFNVNNKKQIEYFNGDLVKDMKEDMARVLKIDFSEKKIGIILNLLQEEKNNLDLLIQREGININIDEIITQAVERETELIKPVDIIYAQVLEKINSLRLKSNRDAEKQNLDRIFKRRTDKNNNEIYNEIEDLGNFIDENYEQIQEPEAVRRPTKQDITRRRPVKITPTIISSLESEVTILLNKIRDKAQRDVVFRRLRTIYNSMTDKNINEIYDQMEELEQEIKDNYELEGEGRKRRKMKGHPTMPPSKSLMRGKGIVKDISVNIVNPVLKYLYDKLDKAEKGKKKQEATKEPDFIKASGKRRTKK